MYEGVIKWFDWSRGTGLIVPCNGGDDVVVEVGALQASGISDVAPGTRVQYDLFVETYRNVAGNLIVC